MPLCCRPRRKSGGAHRAVRAAAARILTALGGLIRRWMARPQPPRTELAVLRAQPEDHARGVPASRAPARPARSSPNPVSVRVSGTLRRQYLLVSPSDCMANVAFGQDPFTQRNRRTRRTRTGRRPAAPSATVREYPPCTRADTDPQAGQQSEEAVHDAEITIAASVSSSRCNPRPRQLREQQDQQVRPLVRDLHDAGGRQGKEGQS